jgi:hypothetical protein
MASGSTSSNVVGVHYRVGKKIGEGSFGVIFEGTNLLNQQQVAIKFEPRKSDAPQLRDEYRTYKILVGCRECLPPFIATKLCLALLCVGMCEAWTADDLGGIPVLPPLSSSRSRNHIRPADMAQHTTNKSNSSEPLLTCRSRDS